MSIGCIIIDGVDKEKNAYAHQIETHIRTSTWELHYPYRFYEETLTIEREKSELIIVITTDLETSLDTTFFGDKDIIIISIIHPYEGSPGREYYESQYITDTYKKAFDTYILEKTLDHAKNGIDFTVIDTSEDISMKLNHFFKHRYAR